MVQGTYKSICEFHPQNNETRFYHEKSTIAERQLKSCSIMDKILSFSSKRIKKIYTLNECCILKCKTETDFERFFSHINLPNITSYFDCFLENRQTFDINVYKDLNPQSAILAPILTPISICCIEKPLKFCIKKYDINQAYLSALCSNNIEFPTGQPKKLVGLDAEQFFNDNILSGQKCFAICKVRIFPSKVDDALKILPFFPIKFKFENEITSALAFCKICSATQSDNVCTHSNFERSFIIECLSDDLIFAVQKLNYSCKVLNLIYFEKTSKFANLSSLALNMYDFRKQSKCKAESFLIKQIILCGLGRFALQPEKYLSNKKEFYTQFELENALSNNEIDYYTIINETCFANVKSSYTNFKFDNLVKNCVKANVSSVIFAIISNKIRRNVFEISLQFIKMKNVHLLRIDVDSILLGFIKSDDDKIRKIFQSIQDVTFKLEFDNISQYVSFKKRCYALLTELGPILKCPGLRLCFRDRCKLNISDMVTRRLESVSLQPN